MATGYDDADPLVFMEGFSCLQYTFTLIYKITHLHKLSRSHSFPFRILELMSSVVKTQSTESVMYVIITTIINVLATPTAQLPQAQTPEEVGPTASSTAAKRQYAAPQLQYKV